MLKEKEVIIQRQYLTNNSSRYFRLKSKLREKVPLSSKFSLYEKLDRIQSRNVSTHFTYLSYINKESQ